MPLTGLEPVRCRQRGILSPLCLPIPPQRHVNYNNIYIRLCQVKFDYFEEKMKGFYIMKKLNSVICMLIAFALLLTGCSGKGGSKTMLYDYSDLDKYVTLGRYKDITVDSSSDEFKAYIDGIIQSDLSAAELYESRELTESDKVENGDTVVIDFVGKMDGKEFDGGSSTDYQLTIGSGSMIEGFESGIIGASLNKTITIDLNFPDPYPNNTDLSGKPVSFDVTVKSGTRITYPEITETIAKDLEFDSKTDYDEDAKERAAQNYLCDLIVDSSEIKSYPEKELEYYLEETTAYYEQMCETYNMTFDDFLANQSMTMEQYEKNVKESLKSSIATQLVFYSIAKKENIEITDADTNAFLETVADQNGITANEAKEQINDGDLEFSTIVKKFT